MKIKNKKKGILFWITGLSGSGKTTLGKKIAKGIEKLHGPTIMISGDDIRKIFKLKGFEHKDRLKITKKYCQFARYLTNQKINVIFAVVGMFNDPRKWNRLNIDNYIEIYIKSNIKTILRVGKKKIYNKKNPGKFTGIEIKPEYPKNPDIIVLNKFNSTTNKMAKLLMNKINKLLNEKK
jgi:adenylylsulfate kinase-like enzyme